MQPFVEVFGDVPSLPEGTTRTLRVFVPSPPDVGGYTLLVMADGQNLFDTSGEGSVSWGVDQGIVRLVSAGQIPPCIVVGVDHRGGERLGDYAPWGDRRLPIRPRGERYAAFVAEHLLPLLRERYPLREGAENAAVAGSSMGGLISLYIAWRYPQLFGRVAALSPTVMLGPDRIFKVWSRHPGMFQRVYLDAGSHEVFDAGAIELDYGEAAVEFHAHLRAVGYEEDELRLVRDPRGSHDEWTWRRRFPPAMRWLWGER